VQTVQHGLSFGATRTETTTTKEGNMSLKRIETARGHRYTLDGKAVPGVTTILSKGLPKPALPYWAAKECARYAADHLDVLLQLPDTESVFATVKQAPWTQRDTAARRGTEIHALAEQIIQGDTVDVPRELDGYVQGLVDWIDEWEFVPILTEAVLGSREHWYAGTLDAIGAIKGGETILLDWKSAKGVYGDNALQLAAYAHAEFIEEGANGKPYEGSVPQVDTLGVVHVTPTGSHLYRVPNPDAAWKQFLAVREVAELVPHIDKTFNDDPDELPVEVSA
jgi:hypothetical protein